MHVHIVYTRAMQAIAKYTGFGCLAAHIVLI